MPPPPPPAPPPPPILSLSSAPKSGNTSRSKLLSEIHQGKRLKKTITNDRSEPIVVSKVSSTSGPSETSSSGYSGSTSTSGKVLGGGIGMIFANGIPRKPSEAKISKIAAQKEEQVTPSSLEIPTSKINSNNINQAPKPPTNIISRKPTLPKTNNLSHSNNTSYLKNINSNTVAPSPPEKPSKIKPILPPTPTTTPLAIPKQALSKPAHNPPKPSLGVVNQFSQNSLVRSESIQPQSNIKRRPAAPPPPPPSFTGINSASTPTQQTPISRGPLPPIPSSTPFVRSCNSPPLPPPRISSYIESVEQRFHFLAITELPPPPQFIGFRKIYDINQRKSALMTNAY